MDAVLQPIELEEIFRDNVRARRKELGLTQADLAKRLKVSTPYVNQLEKDRGSPPQLDTVAKVADALETTPGALLTPGIFSSQTA